MLPSSGFLVLQLVLLSNLLSKVHVGETIDLPLKKRPSRQPGAQALCKDRCSKENGKCLTLSEIESNVRIKQDIPLQQQERDVLHNLNYDVDKKACFCNREAYTGDSCTEECPEGRRGWMCVNADSYCGDLCTAQAGECLTLRETIKVLAKKEKLGRQLVEEEKAILKKRFKQLGRTDEKLCVCRRPDVEGPGCKDACKPGYGNFMCLSRTSVEGTCNQTHKSVDGLCLSRTSVEGTCNQTHKSVDGECVAISCTDACKLPHGECKTIKKIKDRLNYRHLTYSEILKLQNLETFPNHETGEMETCSCKTSGRTGRDCRQECPAGSGGYMCILGEEQCRDICDEVHGLCDSKHAIVDKLVAVYKLPRRKSPELLDSVRYVVNNLVQYFDDRATGERRGCFCKAEHKIGPSCKDDCPPDRKGFMCVITKEAEKNREARGAARIKATYILIADILTDDLKRLKQDLRTKMLQYSRSKIHPECLAKIVSFKGIDLEERRLRRQVGSKTDGSLRVDVEYDVNFPADLVNTRGIQAKLVRAVKQSAKQIPGVKLDEQSVKVTSLRLLNTNESSSQPNYPMYVVGGLAFLAGAMLLMLTVWYALLKSKSRKAAQGIKNNQTRLHFVPAVAPRAASGMGYWNSQKKINRIMRYQTVRI